MILVVSTSLNPDSCSRVLARLALDSLKAIRADVDWLDLQELELPQCDGASCYSHPNVEAVSQKITGADCVLMASPVYNFDLCSAAKNLVELTGNHAWSGKLVGFMLAAGGQGSYMSVMPFANSLMLDFRCLIIPRFVYTTTPCFEDGQLVDEGVRTRIDELTALAHKLTGKLFGEENGGSHED